MGRGAVPVQIPVSAGVLSWVSQMRATWKSGRRRTLLGGSALALCLMAASPEVGAAGAFLTAAGVKVPMPEIPTLNCDEMLDVLAAIDASGYRGAARRPLDEADAPLLEYENRLARTHFQRCVSLNGGSGGESAFARGYEK